MAKKSNPQKSINGSVGSTISELYEVNSKYYFDRRKCMITIDNANAKPLFETF